MLHVDIPLPPSLNHAYVTDWKTKRRYPSPDLESFRSEAIPLIRQAANEVDFIAPPGARYRLTLHLWFTMERTMNASDASNRIKAAEDALGHYDEAKAAQVRAYAAARRWGSAPLHAGSIHDGELRSKVRAELARLEAGHGR